MFNSEREPLHGSHSVGMEPRLMDASALGVATLENELTSDDVTRRTIAQMLAMLRAAVPAASLSAQPISADGRHGGHSVVCRGVALRVSPKQVRREYLERYEREDPFHPSQVVGTSVTMRGTYEHPGFMRNSTNLFIEYARETDLPHFLRIYLRMDRQLVAYLWLARTQSQRPFSERELDFLRQAQPFLESAYVAAVRPAPRAEFERLLVETGLTRREADVARYAATGMRAREIAELLVLTEATVKTHLARVYRKLGVRGKAELAARLRPHDD